MLMLLPFAVLLVRVQHALCAHASNGIFNSFLQGQLGPVFSSRILMRLLIPGVWSLAPHAWFPEHANQLLQIGFTGIGLIATYELARSWLSATAALGVSYLAGAWLAWGMLPMGYSFAYPYDLPTFAFSALGLLALARRDLWGFAGTVFFGVLCKETIVWLLVVVAIMEWRRRGMLFGWWVFSGLVLLAIVCYALPRLGFLGSRLYPFATVELWENKEAKITRVAANIREFGTLAHGSPTENIYWFATIFLPVVFVWRHGLSPFLRACWMGALVLFTGNFICGNVWEVRIFNEIVPLGAVTTFLAFRLVVEGGVEAAPTDFPPLSSVAEPPYPDTTRK
ncbi:MAG: hypothetical protein ACP5QZ_06135 [Candidatus Sumerlaeaceae bacterium]